MFRNRAAADIERRRKSELDYIDANTPRSQVTRSSDLPPSGRIDPITAEQLDSWHYFLGGEDRAEAFRRGDYFHHGADRSAPKPFSPIELTSSFDNPSWCNFDRPRVICPVFAAPPSDKLNKIMAMFLRDPFFSSDPCYETASREAQLSGSREFADALQKVKGKLASALPTQSRGAAGIRWYLSELDFRGYVRLRCTANLRGEEKEQARKQWKRAFERVQDLLDQPEPLKHFKNTLRQITSSLYDFRVHFEKYFNVRYQMLGVSPLHPLWPDNLPEPLASEIKAQLRSRFGPEVDCESPAFWTRLKWKDFLMGNVNTM